MLATRHFQRFTDLTKFINTHPVYQDDILKIDADTASGGWVLFFYDFILTERSQAKDAITDKIKVNASETETVAPQDSSTSAKLP